MVHVVLYGLLAVILAGGLFLVASRFLPAGEQIAPPLRDEPPWDLPADRILDPDDVDAVRLPVALRGYRFAETDILLDRLAGELRARDQEIARLRGHAPVLVDEYAPVDLVKNSRRAGSSAAPDAAPAPAPAPSGEEHEPVPSDDHEPVPSGEETFRPQQMPAEQPGGDDGS